MTILVTGPESSGKTTLARDLAWALDGTYVAEAARDYLEERDGKYSETDLPAIWDRQKKAEDAARASSASFVVCDTGPEVIRIWAEVKYGLCPHDVLEASLNRHYDLILLCRPDLPWEPDPLREARDQQEREDLLERYRKVLADRPYQEIYGKARLFRALRITQEMNARI
ncbi:ATP-binding protein [Neolewinella aurantiaca]|uniref:ATP-binding protein n=1 Tax=Neolewinella aurantiaca TaxID=2602767 RepID=A0A5C7FFM5_9BACT|nr:ATP-binding protein [Neolewinella aurantiaca]TXF88402.1 ATP-binding protein [Neolewinella aurantiaca]